MTTHISPVRRSTLAALAALTLLVALPAAAQKNYAPGVTDTEIKIGNAAPYSGPASAYSVSARVIKAYLDQVNARGGINGRKVVFVTYDDEFSPPKSAEVTRRLIEQDEVLAIVGSMGSASNLAVQKYMNAKKVPQLFISTGGAKFNNPKEFPWTMPLNPSYQGEGRLYAQDILKNHPTGKVAVLYQNDDMGKELLKGLKDGLGDKAKAMLVSEQSYELADPTVDSQVVQLKQSGADVFVNLSLARAAAQAIRKAYDIGWKPSQYLIYNSAFVKSTFEPAGIEKSVGIVSSAFFKDAGQARWNDDPATKDFKAFMAKYAPGIDPNDSIAVYGYSSAQLIEHVLKQAGDNLTRENVMRMSTTLKDVRLPMFLPGVALNNSPEDYVPVNALQIVRFNGKELEPVGAPMRIK